MYHSDKILFVASIIHFLFIMHKTEGAQSAVPPVRMSGIMACISGRCHTSVMGIGSPERLQHRLYSAFNILVKINHFMYIFRIHVG